MKLILLVLLVPALCAMASGQAHSVKKPSSCKANTDTCGPIANESFPCPRFGFTFKIPYGWVDRTDEMQEEPDSPKPETAKSEILLGIFERPPAAPGETINSAVVIAAEPLSAYQGIKAAADYFGPITELAEQRGFKVVNEPQEFSIGTRQLVRGDFNKERGKLTMWQTSLVMIQKGEILSFTFVAGTEDEIVELIERLHFSTAPTHH
jgi:hypothetical protein